MTMGDTAAKRHLSRAQLDEYLNLAAPATIVVPGEPICRVIIDPVRHELSLRAPYRNDRLDVAEFEHVNARVVADSGGQWYEVVIAYADHAHEAYLLLGDVADMVQLSGVPFADAVRSALETFAQLIARSSSLNAEKQIGLYGELLFLEKCMHLLPPPSVVEAWKGFASHEHDIVFADVSFEVKTTKSERRRHQIGSLEQLEPTVGSSLWLLSVQLTSGTSTSGRTLGQLVDAVRAAAGPALSSLNACLEQAGWRERDRSQYREYLALRSTPAAYLVDDEFPVLTRSIIQSSARRPELIMDASYRIDITSLTPAAPPYPAESFVNGGH
jgi:hypothetical protein